MQALTRAFRATTLKVAGGRLISRARWVVRRLALVTATTDVTRTSALRNCHMCHWHSSHSCLPPELSACKLGNRALHHDENTNSSVNARRLGDLGCYCAPAGSVEFVVASPQPCLTSIKIRTLGNFQHFLYCLDGWYLVLYRNWDIHDILNVLDLRVTSAIFSMYWPDRVGPNRASPNHCVCVRAMWCVLVPGCWFQGVCSRFQGVLQMSGCAVNFWCVCVPGVWGPETPEWPPGPHNMTPERQNVASWVVRVPQGPLRLHENTPRSEEKAKQQRDVGTAHLQDRPCTGLPSQGTTSPRTEAGLA